MTPFYDWRWNVIFALFDTETTGLTKHPDVDVTEQPRVIEFGGILTDGRDIIHQLEFICNPEMEIDDVITKITGLTNADLYKQRPFVSHAEDVASYFKQADAAVAHNLSFDKRMMQTEAEFGGISNIQTSLFNFPSIEICTVEQTMAFYGRRMKLSELYEMYFGKYEQKHRAIDDILLLHKICQASGMYDAWKRAYA